MQDDTVHAAAVVLTAAARSTTGLLPHHQRVVVGATKTRWWSRLRAKLLCFRPSHSHPRRVAAHASPEPVHSTSSTNSHFTHHATRPAVAFVAPPSSPASSLLASSESPSPVQAVLLRLDASSSPTASIFAVGPYAREPQQLVSPPAFSAGLTEPSTAPLTPPPESAGSCLLPGSSPEVPFACFLSPSFQTYQLQPGSPALVSPPAAWMRRHSEEGSPPSGEFVFGRTAAEWTTFAAHRRFLEALQLHGRAWRRIQEHIATKTAVQIRSHAQKFFTKVIRESFGSESASGGAAPAIQIPPPRPKRKPLHPYPRKVDDAAKKHALMLKQLEKPPPPRMQSLREQDDWSPTSVLTAAQTALRADALDGGVFSNTSSGGGRSRVPSVAGSDEHGNGGGSSVDREEYGCLSPGIPGAELAVKAPDTKAFGDAKGCTGSDAPVFKLFGKRVAVKDSYQHLQNGRNLEMDSSPTFVTQATRNAVPFAGANSWNPWPANMQQVMYFLPGPDGFPAQSVLPWLGYNGSLPCSLFYPQAVASNQQQHHQPSVSPEQGAGSLTGSNSASNVAPASAAQNSDAVESLAEQGNASESVRAPAVKRLSKCPSSASTNRRGFMPYKRCAAQSDAPLSVAPREEADGDLTRLCL